MGHFIGRVGQDYFDANFAHDVVAPVGGYCSDFTGRVETHPVAIVLARAGEFHDFQH
jgi:hypothetical protein